MTGQFVTARADPLGGTDPSGTPAAKAPDGRDARSPSTIRRTLGLLVPSAALVVLVLLSIAVGAKAIPLGEVLTALGDNTGQGDAYVVWDLRVPRTVVGLAVGIALGVSGALMQALTRNPLADPGILGVSAGAAFAVAVAIALLGVSTIQGYLWFAFLGAMAATVAVYVIGSAGRGGGDPVQMTLAGVALSAVLSGIVTALVLLDPNAFAQMLQWNAGSTVGRGWDVVVPMVPFLVVGLLLAALVAPALNAVALGDDQARSLGVNVSTVRVGVIVAVTLLAGAATAIAGPIAFVGLAVPHIARWFVGPDQPWILAYTVVLAPCLVLAADIAGRVVMRPAELPVGIVTAFVGAPVLILLVRRRRASGL